MNIGGPSGPAGADYEISMPGLAGPKMPGMGGGSGNVRRIVRKKPPRTTDDDQT